LKKENAEGNLEILKELLKMREENEQLKKSL